ncbi:hypothetical protein [Parasphingorhabdus sp.]|uniref:hypothetical protein n=1 Tax=Parasphingorhabdus sp. TaxID=2709688 RepID=UPI003001AC98
MKKAPKLLTITIAGSALAFAFSLSFVRPAPVAANVSFARDTGLSCSACHSTPSNPTKQQLTRVGVGFQSCLYNPNPGTMDCNRQAGADSRAFAGSPNASGYGQNAAPVYPQNPNAGYPPTTGQGYPPQGQGIVPAAPPKKSNGVRDFLLGLLGAGAAPATTSQSPGYQTTTPRSGPTQTGYNPNQNWAIVERLANGVLLDAVWQKRPGTTAYDAVYIDSRNQSQTTDTVFYQGTSNGQISFRRQGTGTIYTGRLAPNGQMVMGGTTNKSPNYLTWTGAAFNK